MAETKNTIAIRGNTPAYRIVSKSNFGNNHKSIPIANILIERMIIFFNIGALSTPAFIRFV